MQSAAVLLVQCVLLTLTLTLVFITLLRSPENFHHCSHHGHKHLFFKRQCTKSCAFSGSSREDVLQFILKTEKETLGANFPINLAVQQRENIYMYLQGYTCEQLMCQKGWISFVSVALISGLILFRVILLWVFSQSEMKKNRLLLVSLVLEVDCCMFSW